MTITFLWLGKSKNKHYDSIIDDYKKRLKHYTSFSIKELKDPKHKSKKKDDITKAEAELILSKLSPSDYVVLLDELGKHKTSEELSNWVQHKLNISISNVIFIIAGAYGAHPLLKDRADYKFALSHLTLTHDMARMFIIEQVYRAFTILKGEKYHNS